MFTKSTNSAWKGPGFAEAVDRLGSREVVLVGMATDACVTASAREALDLGFVVTVVDDATAAFARTSPEGRSHPAGVVHEVSLAALAASGIRGRSTADLLRQLRPGPAARRD